MLGLRPFLFYAWPATVIPPKVPSRGYASIYREAKIAAHTTQRGAGKVARLRIRRKGHADRG